MARLAQQKDLIEGRNIPELDAASENVRHFTGERMALHAQEIASREILLKLMRKHDKTRYVYDGYVAKIVPGIEKVSVRRIKEKKAGTKRGEGTQS